MIFQMYSRLMRGSLAVVLLFLAHVASAAIPDPLPPSIADKQIGGAIEEVVAAMKADGWRPPPTSTGNPNPGAFGRALQDLMNAKMKGQDEWLMDAYFRKNLDGSYTLVGFRNTPPGYDPRTLINVDAIKLKPGYTPEVLQRIDRSQIEDIYEIKATARGITDDDQLAELKKFNPKGKVKLVQPSQVFRSTTGRWGKLMRFAMMQKTFKAIGWASMVTNMIMYDDLAEEFEKEFVPELKNYYYHRTAPDGDVGLAANFGTNCVTKMNGFIAKFLPPTSSGGGLIDVLTLVQIDALLIDLSD